MSEEIVQPNKGINVGPTPGNVAVSPRDIMRIGAEIAELADTKRLWQAALRDIAIRSTCHFRHECLSPVDYARAYVAVIKLLFEFDRYPVFAFFQCVSLVFSNIKTAPVPFFLIHFR